MRFEAVLEAIDATVESELERTGQPGLTLGVTAPDETLAVRTYGFADLASRAPVTPEMLFEIGSIGKTFTAILVLQFADEGKIELQAPVDRYLPWFDAAQRAGDRPITIAHLLSHTSGIVAGIDGTPEAAFQVWSLRDLPTRSAPGERFHYSNVGYKALGLVLEAVAGRPHPELLRERILRPLGMSATEPEITHDLRARLAVGYEYLHDDRDGHPGAPLAPATWLETATADGSIASTAADMCAFARLLMRRGEGPAGRLLSEEAFAEMATRRGGIDETAGYGYGLILRELDGRRFVGHGGGMVGYLAGLQVDVEAALGAVVLQNGVSANPMALARRVIAIVRDGPAAAGASNAGDRAEAGEGAPVPPPPANPADELRAIAGHYRSHSPWTTNFRVVLRGDGPWLTFAAAPDGFDDEQPLVPEPDGSFRVGEDPGNPESLRFDTVVDGRALRAWISGWPYYRAADA
ncbi:MAG TPA: serine hydrolase domain-containing protein [Gaiellaceae bacterium]|nr:serine hydrolase domain-containing protein [Gaiellaceae bacterium]